MAGPSENHRIDYVEFKVQDIARSRAFYGAAFGWSFKDYGPKATARRAQERPRG